MSEQLARHAQLLAETYQVTHLPGSHGLLERLNRNEDVIRAFHRSKRGPEHVNGTPPASEWLLDNFYLIEDQMQMARRHFPPSYSRELPRLTHGPSKDYPRVYDLCLELISHLDAQISGDSLNLFFAAFQTVTPLKLGELWAVPIMLRLGLIENLQRITTQLSLDQNERREADEWVDRMVTVCNQDASRIVIVVAQMADASIPLTPAFVAQFCQRLARQDPALQIAREWLDHRLMAQDQSIAQLVRQDSQIQAENQVSVSNSIISLRLLPAMNWKDFVEELSVVEQILRRDPGGTYAQMDFSTRDHYRHRIEALARCGILSEQEVATEALQMATEALKSQSPQDPRVHIGYYLVDDGQQILDTICKPVWSRKMRMEQLIRNCPLASFLGGIALVTLLLTVAYLAGASSLGMTGVPLIVTATLFAFAVSQTAVALVNWVFMMTVRPAVLSRLDFSAGIPADCSTVVAIPCMLTSADGVDHLIEKLEIHYLANRDPALHFALISDFRDSASETAPEDNALLQRVSAGIEELRHKYEAPGQSHFYLFHRARKWNPSENTWMGFERKRGKLSQFNAILCGGSTTDFDRVIGDISVLVRTRYVITLDTDTQLPLDSAQMLVGTIAHPLNRAHIDPVRNIVTRGYGILQPRIGVNLPTSRQSWFVRIFAGDAGIDPYTRAVSDTYQDIFGEGTFVGKGIYDIHAFETTLRDRFADNTVLSHDLIESCFARSGLVSDVVLFEDYPSRYDVDADRRHRWMRGDWQISPWILSRVRQADGILRPNPLSAVSRWKLIDNLRRSLVPLSLVCFFLLFWIWAPALGWFATLMVFLIIVLPEILSSLRDAASRTAEVPFGLHMEMVAGRVATKSAQTIFLLALLPYEAYLSIDAIGRTLYRMLVSRKNLLVWKTSGDTEASRRHNLTRSYIRMYSAPLFGLSTIAILLFIGPTALPLAMPVLFLWTISPWMAWRISRPIVTHINELTDPQRCYLRRLARKTYWFFEQKVTEQDNWLPPDNYQIQPYRGLASRTSPTNIGFALLANLSARDMGYISTTRLLKRTTDTLNAMDRLQTHEGHYYNWYDTRTLEPLLPLYISTVDSGNLAGMLLTMAAGLREIRQSSVLNSQMAAGLVDTIEAIRQSRPKDPFILPALALCHDEPSTLAAAHQMLLNLQTKSQQAALAADSAHSEGWMDWKQLTEQCQDHLQELEALFTMDSEASTTDPYLQSVIQPSLRILAHRDLPYQSPCTLCREIARSQVGQLEDLARRCEMLAGMEWDFLYNTSRKLFSIGYNVSECRLDTGHYDLLASESRLGSFVAIAQGRVDQEHWFSLGRLLVKSQGGPVLLSWSGSMFEYLMPQLLMPSYEGTLINSTCLAAVRHQIDYGRLRSVPWGVSESGYNRTDAQLNYQYRAFGAPGVGLQRGLAEDLVIAPYASALALMITPRLACENLQRLSKEEREGGYGFYEAIDYTPQRMPPGQTSTTVQSHMAHHQGMVLLSLLSVLRNRPMQRRFASCPELRATDLLLHERIPNTGTNVFSPEMEYEDSIIPQPSGDDGLRVMHGPYSASPEIHLLSNGRYHVAISRSGAGFSRWNQMDVTRWREDSTQDCWGYFIYLRDQTSGEFWSVGHQPTRHTVDHYEAIFAQGRAEFRQRNHGLSIHTEITVSPEDDVEIRRVSITNHTMEQRSIELTSYAEVVMASAAADASHPAFSNLFVETEFDSELATLFCFRRSRKSHEETPCLFHLVTDAYNDHDAISYETDRMKFVGRGTTLADPAMMAPGSRMSRTTGAVLDPIVSLRRLVELPPGGKATVIFLLGMAQGRPAARDLAIKYRNLRMGDRAFELAWTHSQVMLRQLDATQKDAHLYSRLAGALIYANGNYRADQQILRRNRRGQSSLWAYGISGDVPIVLLQINQMAQIDIVRQLVKAYAFWRMKGLTVELVIINEDPTTYRQSLQEAIINAVVLGGEGHMTDKAGGILVRRHEQIAEENLILLQSVARIVFNAANGPLINQVRETPTHDRTTARYPRILPGPRISIDSHLPYRDLRFDNELGGFTGDGREYVITLQPNENTPRPWVNVIANPHFGTVISESGGAYTWIENAREFRLTPWNNDPVVDTSGEAMYLRDDQTGDFWSPTPQPARGTTAYVTRHGFGYTVFEHTENGLFTELTVFVAMDAPVKISMLRIRNLTGRTRQVSAVGYVEWLLSDRRSQSLMHTQTEVDLRTGAILARNPYNTEFPDRIAFLDVNHPTCTHTGDRREFIGRNESLNHPNGLRSRTLSGRVGAGLDPCGAVMVPIEIPPGSERRVIFRLGMGRSIEDVHELIERYRMPGAADAALSEVWSHWNQTLSAVTIQTPDPSVNIMANGWLLYQTLSCRMWARTGFYQSGGAFGFRDQLQDSMALVHSRPALVRAHILLAAAHQFQQGDVQHWWHPPAGRGVRTHISDDFLWLPYVTSYYVTTTGDTGILQETVPYLEGRVVKDTEEAYYDLPLPSHEVGTLYDHCVRALTNGMRYGEHGLPLMGSGDWNDGLNAVGQEGRGESVWLGWFQYAVLQEFIPISRIRKDDAFADRCLTQAQTIQANLEKHAWDGKWYLRAFHDNGESIGSAGNEECQIDSIAQSWGVISGAADPARARSAMAAVDERLVRQKDGLILLFDPPFDKGTTYPGYIQDYVPGVRENGGQYTHAAIWTIMAVAMMGDHDRAWELFNLINPINHSRTPAEAAKYGAEPFVIAADVYGVAPHTGRGGWTWYTGSAGYAYRLILETLLGIKRRGDRLHITPRLPHHWPEATVHFRHYSTNYHITIKGQTSDSPTSHQIRLDGELQPGDNFPLRDDQQNHHISVHMAKHQPADHTTAALPSL